MGSSQAQARDELVGRVFNDRFRLVELIARGGMGRVYRAEQIQLGRIVAVKTLNRSQDADAGSERVFQERFLNEASVTSRLQHPNTVRVFDFGRTPDGICFIAMELVDGRSLLSAIEAGAPFSAERTAHIALQIARSLREAHRLDVIHRDLKPANVLLTQHDDQHDFVKVVDFGLVKQVELDERKGITREGLFLGSPKYMAPEQILGEAVDARADVYSLGVCMYEMLTGRAPFERESTVKTLMAQVHEVVPPMPAAGIPDSLKQVVMRCLAKSRDARIGSMEEVIGALNHLASPGTMASGEYTIHPDPALPLALRAAQQEAERVAGPAESMHGEHPLQPARGPSKRKAAILICLVALVAGTLAILVSKKSEPIGEAAPKSKITAVAPAAVTAARSVKPAVADVPPESPTAPLIYLLLTSEPSGAFVTVYGRQYGPTPAHVEVRNDLVVQGHDISAVFERSGFDPVSVTRVIAGGELRLHGLLSRSDSGRAHTGAPQSASGTDTSESTASAPSTPTPAAVQPAAIAAVAPPAPARAPAAPPPSAVSIAAPAARAATVPAAQATPQPPKAKVAPPVVTPSTLVRSGLRAPEYPRSARRAGIEGTVVARVHVQPNGSVSTVDILSGPEVFYEEVRSALGTWKYTPAKLPDGKVTADTHVVQVPFKLQ